MSDPSDKAIRFLAAVTFRLLVILIGFWPRKLFLFMVRILVYPACFFAGRECSIAMSNLNAVYGSSLSRREKRAIVRESMKSFLLMALDLFWFSWRRDCRLARYLRIDASVGEDLIKSPAILVTAHFGNWEVMGMGLGLLKKAVLWVASPFDSPFAEAFVRVARNVDGQTVTPRHGAMRALVSTLRDGGSVALLLDQNTRIREGGCFVDFFGLAVPVSKAAEKLSLHSGTAVLPVFTVLESDGGYRFYAGDKILSRDFADKPSGSMTQEITSALEREIRLRPGQWLWLYKRWKYVPEGSVIEKYPFYAKSFSDSIQKEKSES